MHLLISFTCNRYFVRVVIVRRISDLVKEHDVAVHTLSTYPDLINRLEILIIICGFITLCNFTCVHKCTCSLKMEVGIEDCLHIEFEYNKSK